MDFYCYSHIDLGSDPEAYNPDYEPAGLPNFIVWALQKNQTTRVIKAVSGTPDAAGVVTGPKIGGAGYVPFNAAGCFAFPSTGYLGMTYQAIYTADVYATFGVARWEPTFNSGVGRFA